MQIKELRYLWGLRTLAEMPVVSSVMTLSYLYTNYQEGEILNTVYEVFITNRKLQQKMQPGRKEKSQETNHAGKKPPTNL